MAAETSTPTLFTPFQLGDLTLKHRIVLAPLTRFRADDEHVHTDMAVEYYAQRAAVPGTFMLSEATFIAPQAGGYPNAPGIWSDAQVAAWKKIVDAVHARGSFIFLQLWAIGRAAVPAVLEKEGPYPYVSASDIPMTGSTVAPRPLTVPEIKEYVQLFATAASNAVHGAGFDGVELHGGNGYLTDQFLQDVSNKRTDDYGGSIENRAKFTLEVIDAVVAKVGAKKTAIRLSPWSTYQDMREMDPMPTFTYLVKELAKRDLAYLHGVEPRVAGNDNRAAIPGESNDFMRNIWQPLPYFSAGGHTRETALEGAETQGVLITFGRWYTSNPDLPLRLKKNLPLTQYDRNKFYNAKQVDGYTTWTVAAENEAELVDYPPHLTEA